MADDTTQGAQTPAPTPTPTPTPSAAPKPNQGNKSKNQGGNKPAAAAQTTTAAPAAQSTATSETTPAAPAQDRVVLAAPAPTPPAPVEAPVVTEEAGEPVVDVEGEHKLVAELNAILADFKAANEVIGSKPEDFKNSARLASGIVRFVTRNPKPFVFNALLAFFKAELNGVCSYENFMKGSTTLSKAEEAKVGFLYNMFVDLARGQAARMESATILRVLEKPEFVNFYNRRINVQNQNR